MAFFQINTNSIVTANQTQPATLNTKMSRGNVSAHLSFCNANCMLLYLSNCKWIFNCSLSWDILSSVQRLYHTETTQHHALVYLPVYWQILLRDQRLLRYACHALDNGAQTTPDHVSLSVKLENLHRKKNPVRLIQLQDCSGK